MAKNPQLTGSQNDPLVSVLICNYNYGKFISEAIESVLAQTWKNLEIIVVDDGSTDGSRQILENYRERVRIILKENGGQASAFNVGISEANGEIICFLDSDDFWYPEKVKSVVEVYRDGSWGLVCHDLHEVNDKARKISDKTHSKTHNNILCNGDLRDVILARGYSWVFPPTSGLSLPTKLARKLLPLPEEEWRICADNPLCYAAVCHAPVRVMDAVLGAYRYHGKNGFASHRRDPDLKRIQNIKIRVMRYFFLQNYLKKIGLPAAEEEPKDTYRFYRQCCFIAREKPWRSLYSLWQKNIQNYRSSKNTLSISTKFESAKYLLLDATLSILMLVHLPTPYREIRKRYCKEADKFNPNVRKYLETERN